MNSCEQHFKSSQAPFGISIIASTSQTERMVSVIFSWLNQILRFSMAASSDSTVPGQTHQLWFHFQLDVQHHMSGLGSESEHSAASSVYYWNSRISYLLISDSFNSPEHLGAFFQ